ncbi:hypothetical protein Tsubulata_021818, partial [Turnera subulata]
TLSKIVSPLNFSPPVKIHKNHLLQHKRKALFFPVFLHFPLPLSITPLKPREKKQNPIETMSSAPKKRPKLASKPQNKNPSSSSSSLSSYSPIMEPPTNLFPSKGEFLRLIAVVTIASSVAFTCNFLYGYFNPTTKPFYDSNLDSPDSISDFCEPCPSNGECNQGMLECARGYQRHGNTCVEDGDINQRAKKLVCSDNLTHGENRLCVAYANFLCDGTGAVWIHEDDIWNDLGGHQVMEKYGSDDLLFVHAKRRAMEFIGTSLEMRNDAHGNRFPVLWFFVIVEGGSPYQGLQVLGSSFLVWKLRRRWYLSTRSEELYIQVCEILEEQALMSKRVNAESEPWVVASRLRDHVLLPKERRDPVLWRKVEQLVQEDSRVDRYPKIVKGESKVVWEWQVEGSLSSERMRRKMGSKMKSPEGFQANSEPHHYALKSGELSID